MLLHCPNCDEQREGIFHQENVERFDETLDKGAEHLAQDYRRLVRANMADELGRFVSPLVYDPAPGAKRVQSNDVFVDDRGLIFLLDRIRGFHILERI